MKNEELTINETTPIMENTQKPLILKCKPTYNFQSIEFEMQVDNDCDLVIALNYYETLLKELIRIAPEQPTNPSNKKTNYTPATEKQMEILRRFGIKCKIGVSKQEANKLIQESIEKSKE